MSDCNHALEIGFTGLAWSAVIAGVFHCLQVCRLLRLLDYEVSTPRALAGRSAIFLVGCWLTSVTLSDT